MNKEQEEPQDNYDIGQFLKKGEHVINVSSIDERVLTSDQWRQVNLES